MNITPQVQTLPIATVVNPQADTLRRENNNREVIVKPEAAAQSAAEKSLGSEKDRAKTPSQLNESYDFVELKKKAEEEDQSINDRSSDPEQKNPEQEQREERAKELADQKEINELKRRDLEVRTHEQAHAAVGGPYTGSPSYDFDVGPDGKKYAVSGEVSVDLTPVSGDPQATIVKMQKVHAAALAPANPSAQDTKVARQATKMIVEAQSELYSQKVSEMKDVEESSTSSAESNEIFDNSDTKSSRLSEEFDAVMHDTLKAQERVSPSQIDDEVKQRSNRIEMFYLQINQAYEKPPRNQFELTA